MEKTDFKTNYMEIIMEGIDNLSSNLKVFIQSCNFKESKLNYVFEGMRVSMQSNLQYLNLGSLWKEVDSHFFI